MLRRALTALAMLLAAASAAGCAALPLGSSADAAEALSVLRQADEASKNVQSMTFYMTMKGDAASRSFTIDMFGGGYVKGERAGDMAFRMATNDPASPLGDFQVVVRDGIGYAAFGGSWHRLRALAFNPDQIRQLESQLGALDIVKHVKDVKVESDTFFLGEPVTKISATIDARQLLTSLFGQLGSALGQSGSSTFQVPDEVVNGLGDVRVAIYVSDRTKLFRAVHEDFSMTLQGQTAHFALDMSVVGINEPVDIPTPAVA